MSFDWNAGPWQAELDAFLSAPEGRALRRFLESRGRAGARIFPPDPFRGLRLTDPRNIRVVILGQDPYHGRGQANGLAFSVYDGVPMPPSLRNIFLEIGSEYDGRMPPCVDLSGWARQGVLLLNAVLTVEEGRAGSHARQGWERFTDRILARCAAAPGPRVFLLWGGWAQKKRDAILARCGKDTAVLCANHPSPLSARRPPVPFLGCGHFRAADEWLVSHGAEPVDWFAGP